MEIRNPLLDFVECEFFEETKFEKKITCKLCGSVLLDSQTPGDRTRDSDVKRLCLHFTLMHDIAIVAVKGGLTC